MGKSLNDYLNEYEEKYGGASSNPSSGDQKEKSLNDYLNEYDQKSKTVYVENRQRAENNVQAWIDRINAAMEGYQIYSDALGDRWEKDYGGEWYQKLSEAYDEYDSIRKDSNLIGYDSREAYDLLKQATQEIGNYRAYLNQYDSEESYEADRKKRQWNQKYQGQDYRTLNELASGITDEDEKQFVKDMAANGYMEHLRTLDIAKAQREVEDLKRRREQSFEYDWTDSASRAKARQDGYADQLRDLDYQITEKEKEIAQARRAQKADSMSQVGNPQSQSYDSRFSEMSQYRRDSQLSRLINETDADRAWRKQQEETWGESELSQKGYDRLTQEEKAVFNYWDSYDAQNGTSKAQEYLDSIQEILNSRKAEAIFDQTKDYNWFLKVPSYVAAGMEGAIQGISDIDKILLGKEDYTPASATQMAISKMLQQERETGHKVPELLQDAEGGRTWEEFAGQGLMSVGNMIPSMAVSGVIGMVAPALGAGAALTKGLARAGGLGVMGAGIAGNVYTEAVNQGYSKENARAYAFANAASEVATELVFGGIEGMTGIGTEAAVAALTKNIDSAVLNFLIRTAGDGLGETFEEGFQAILDPWITNITLNQKESIHSADVLYNMLSGFATGMVMSGPSIALDEYGTYRTGLDAKGRKIDTDALRELAEGFDTGTQVRRLAGKIDKNAGPYVIGRTLNEMGAGLNEQNIRDISRYLMQNGLPQETAEHNARLLGDIAAGARLSKKDQRIVDADDLLAEAFLETVLNPDSSVNQRTKGFQKLLGSEKGSKGSAESPVSRRNQNGDAAMNNQNRAVLAVESREGDTMQLRLKNGDSVDSSDMRAYHDENEALLFDTVRKFSKDVAGANLIANGFEGSNVSMQEYCKGVEDCYRYGLYGMNESEVGRGSLSSAIDPGAAHSAYMAGIREAGTRAAQQQKAAMEARKPGQKASLHFDRKGRKFDAKRETALATMEQLSKALGVDFWVFESYDNDGSRVYADETGAEHDAPNGWYDENGIHIDLNAGNDGRGVMLYTLAHELTHHIRAYSPEKFKAFADVVMQGYADRNISAEKLIQQQIAKAKKNGRTITYDEAYEDVIADSMEGILSDGKVLETLKGLQESDPSLWERVKQWAKDIAEKIRAIVEAYQGERPDSREGRMVAAMEEILPQLEQLYAEGLADTAGAVDAGTKNAAKDGGVKYHARRLSDDDIPDYLNAGSRKNKSKISAWNSGQKIVLTSENEITEFIDKAIDKQLDSNLTVAYGKVNDRLAQDVFDASNGKIIINDNYLELIPDNLRHSYEQHSTAKQDGDIDLDRADFEKIPEYLDSYTEVVYAIKYSSGKVGVCVSKKLPNGRILLIETVSKSRGALQFKNAIGVSEEKYRTDYADVYKKGAGTNTGGSKNSNNSPHDESNSDNSILDYDSVVNQKFSDRDPDAGKMNRILQKQNAELKDTVEYLKELVKLQGKVTDGTVYTWGSVEAAARQLMRGAGAKGDVVELRKILEKTYKAMGEGSDSMTGLIDQAAQWLVEHQKGVDLEDVGASELNVQRMNIWESFTKLVPIKTTADRNKARVESLKQRYTEKIQSIRQTYQSQIDQLKQQWKEDVKAVREQMQEKAAASQQAAKAQFRQQQEDLKAARQDTKIMEREFLRLVREAEKTSKAADTAKSKAEALKAALDAEVKKHKEDNADWEREFKRLSREYDKADRNADALQAQLEKTRKAASQRVESRKQTAVRNQLKDIHSKLNRMLTNPGKGVTEHAPTALTKAVADVCELFISNLEQAGVRRAGEYDAKIQELSGKLAENPELKYARSGMDAAQRQKLRIAEQGDKLAELIQQYEKINENSHLSIYYDEHTSSLLEKLDKQLRGKDIYEMTSKELEAVKDTMQSFYHTIKNANQIWLGDHAGQLRQTVDQWEKEINDVNVGFIRKFLGRHINLHMSPDTMFMAFSGFAKNGVGEQVQKMFSKGTERQIQVHVEYYNQFSPITENKAYRAELKSLLGTPWKRLVDVGLKDRNGDAMKLTRGMMMELYMLLNQKDSFEAIVYSGLKIPDQKVYYKDRSRAYGDKELNKLRTDGLGESAFSLSRQIEEAERNLKRGEYGGLSEEDFRQNLEQMQSNLNSMVMGEEARLLEIRSKIEGMLTPMERACIEAARRWYTRSGELMADAHEEIHGYRPKLIDDYAPTHRNMATVWTDVRDVANAFNLENSGFLKERVKNQNAIVLTDFFAELAGQRDAIAAYYGYAKAQKDFGRILKLKIPGSGTSISEMIGTKFGEGKTFLGISGTQYVENYIQDIAGGRKGNEGLLNKFYGAMASKTLTFNPRVALSQLASIPTAAGVVGWKNMSVGFVKGLGTAVSRERKNELAQKNPFFFQRYRGSGGITEIADLSYEGSDWNRISKSGVGKWLLNWCQAMDVFATSTMYAMAQESAAGRGFTKGSPEFDQAANEIYTEIIRRSQPNYTVTERSELLRDNRAGMKMLNMFKTQANQNLNLLMQTSGKLAKLSRDYRDGKNGVTRADVVGAGKAFANAGSAVIMGNVVYVLMRVGVNLAMAQVKGYRDEETGEVTPEAVRDAAFREFLSSMVGMFALGGFAYDAIYSMFSGEKYYGLTDSAINIIVGVVENSVKVAQKQLHYGNDYEEWTKEQRLKDAEKLFSAFAGTKGAPYDNAKKFLDAYDHWMLNLEKGSLFNYSDRDTTKAQYRNRFLKAYQEGNEDLCNDILTILTVEADGPTMRRSISEVREGFRDTLKQKFKDQGISEEAVHDIMESYLDADPEDVSLMISGWKGEGDTGMTAKKWEDQYLRRKVDSDAYISYLIAYQEMDQEKAEEKELRLRCERDTGYAYDEIKEAYMDEAITGQEAAEWLRTYGKVENAEKKLMEYDFEDETGYNWSDKKLCYLDEAVSRDDLKQWLIRIDGKRIAEAEEYLKNLDFEKENGYAYDEKLEMYVSGKITRQQLKDALMGKGQMFEGEADRELVAYDYIKDHPNTALGITAAYSYTRKIDNCDYTIASSGLTEEQFLSFREQKNQCKGTDEDGDGFRDSGSVQAQVLPIIDAMPISEEQKDTLWFFCGWSKRTLNRKAPWKKRR